MKTTKKVCSGCGELKIIWKNHEGNKYCKYCWLRMSAQTKDVKKKPTSRGNNSPRSPISKKSKTRTKEESLYLKLRKEFLLSSPLCKARIPGICTVKATDVHHRKGRGRWYLTVKYWLPVCRACHEWIENHPVEAKALGYSIDRLTDEEED